MTMMTYSQAINSALDYALAQDPEVFFMGIDVAAPGGVLGVTQGLQEKHGKRRVRDTPITESAFIGAAVGAARVRASYP